MKSFRVISTLLGIIAFTASVYSGPVENQDQTERLPETRRILNGKDVGETRPYMVYLRPGPLADKQFGVDQWLCGGVIIHPRYILTSAACIDHVKNFYVVSGTNTWTPVGEESECVKYGAKKAIWKCVPKDYYFDGEEFDNVRWMAGDIAVVKVEENFNFEKRIRGCDYAPKMIAFNNISQEFEKAKTMASTTGWGSPSTHRDIFTRSKTENSMRLLETDVQIMSKNNCKKKWEFRYHNIIDHHMICTKDSHDGAIMSAACVEQGVDCKELEYSHEEKNDEDDDDVQEKRFRAMSRRALDRSNLEVHGSQHQANTSRRHNTVTGGFCENDHGGPLVVGHGTTSMVVGIISACMTREISQKCYGPYLYTSVWNHRHLISCAIDKDVGATETCRRAFGDVRSSNDQLDLVTFEALPEFGELATEAPTGNSTEHSPQILPLELLI